MTATNHAISGALIGLAFGTPAVAIPLAFVYHFALDAVPHYDLPGDEAERVGSKRFRKQLLVDATLCAVIVLLLVLRRPEYWLVGALSAFACAAPDLFWLPKFLAYQQGRTVRGSNPFWRFHNYVQWKTGPELWWVEVLWLVGFGALLVLCL